MVAVVKCVIARDLSMILVFVGVCVGGARVDDGWLWLRENGEEEDDGGYGGCVVFFFKLCEKFSFVG